MPLEMRPFRLNAELKQYELTINYIVFFTMENETRLMVTLREAKRIIKTIKVGENSTGSILKTRI